MSLVRPEVDRIGGYVPGEQPQDAGWIKLNSNENPYPPSPEVVEAIAAAGRGRLNVYPDALATPFREAAADLFNIDPDWILPGNGSDENLTILLRTFVNPGEQVACPYPSYILYETLAALQGAHHVRVPLATDWSWDFETAEPFVTASKLFFVPNPNSPSGNRWSDDDLKRLIPPTGILVLDEAYGDFCETPHRGELLQTDVGKCIVMTRTLSKSYSLAGIRFGFAVAHPDLIAQMRKVKDSYNCDAVSIAAATAAIRDQAWMQQNANRIRDTRTRLAADLATLGFDAIPSEANFVWATLPEAEEHRRIYLALKERHILVRYMQFPGWPEEGKTFSGLRITIGTDDEINVLLENLREVMST